MKVIKPSSKQFLKLFNRFVSRNARIEESVRRILSDVRENGDDAVLRYTRNSTR